MARLKTITLSAPTIPTPTVQPTDQQAHFIRMPKALIRQIAETYSISYEWLMTGKGVMETGRNDREIELKMIMEALRSNSELRGM